MVFTHVPANVLLMSAALMPSAGPAVACLLARSLLSQMDVPARTSYVMAVVDPEERTAAAAITNVPRSLASALPPLAAGWMLQHSNFGWPLIVGGVLKIAYDLTLLAMFRDVRPPEEMAGHGIGSRHGTHRAPASERHGRARRLVAAPHRDGDRHGQVLRSRLRQHHAVAPRSARRLAGRSR